MFPFQYFLQLCCAAHLHMFCGRLAWASSIRWCAITIVCIMFNSFCINSNTVALAILTAYLVLFGSFPLCYQQCHRVKICLWPSEISDMRLLCYIYFFLLQVESVDSFLQSLGLEKYAVTFQAEEVCSFPLLLSFSVYL